MAHDEVTYETLKGRLYREKRSPSLAKLDADFYSMAERHLRELQEEYRREQAANATSPKAMVLHDELWNLQRVREDLYELRERKILMAAVAAARGGNPDRGAMTSPEVELYEAIVRVLKDARRAMLKRATQTAPQESPLSVPVGGETTLAVPPASRTAPAEPGEGDPVAHERPLAVGRAKSGRVLIRPLEDLPAFTAPDLRTYRLRHGDLAAVPAEVARALAQAGKVEVLEAVPASG